MSSHTSASFMADDKMHVDPFLEKRLMDSPLLGCAISDVRDFASGEGRGNSTKKSVTTSVSSPTIYRVPQRIRRRKENAPDPYEPQIVSIGPYHKNSLKGFEDHKRWYQDSIFSGNEEGLENCRKEIAKLEGKARRCYADNVGPMESNEFVEMMVLDGCFIVELFLKSNSLKQNEELSDLKQKEELEQTEEFPRKQKEEELQQTEEEELEKEKPKVDLIFETIWMLPLIRYDMLLLENQIPFFVLQCIFEMASPGNGSLEDLALDFFEPIMPGNKKIPIKNSNYSYHHLLDLFYSHLMPIPRKKSDKWKKLHMFLRSKGFLPNSNEDQLPISDMDPNSNEDQLPISDMDPNSNPEKIMIPCASDLQLAGVKFKKKKDFISILEVEFSHGVFKIPRLVIDDYSNTLFRNLVAFEQCCYPRATTHFTTYLRLMDCLVNTSKDVSLLRDNGIIDHLLGSDDDVAHLFNQLCYGTFVCKYNYPLGLFKDVDEYYNTQWHIWCASFRRDYCINPCTCLTSIAAAILIVVTILQTIYTIYPYYRS